MRVYNNITECIGKTPLFSLERFVRHYNIDAKILGKAEYFNPAGSIKDRAALYMILEAERTGRLSKNSIIIEPTSGNTGIALAAIASARGYRVILTMPESMSIERRKLLAAYGAEIVLTEASKGMSGAIEKARELENSYENCIILGQFENKANAQAHYNTTGPEIYEDTDGTVDILVGGIGTGGTVSGTGAYLKKLKPSVKIIGVEPLSSPFLTTGRKGAHKLQGIGAGFKPDILDMNVIDEVIAVSDDDAYKASRDIAKTEGLLVGISSGAALYAALQIAGRSENLHKTIAVIMPDSGDRYLSTDLFGNI